MDNEILKANRKRRITPKLTRKRQNVNKSASETKITTETKHLDTFGADAKDKQPKHGAAGNENRAGKAEHHRRGAENIQTRLCSSYNV